jgi:hypothetical protein
MSANRFHNSWESFEKTCKIKFLLASMKSLTNHNNENPFINLLKEACPGFPIAAYDTKSCSEKVACDPAPENCSHSTAMLCEFLNF